MEKTADITVTVESKLVKELEVLATKHDESVFAMRTRAFTILQPAINSNDIKVWKATTRAIAASLGNYKSLNDYREKTGSKTLYQRVTEFTWAVENVAEPIKSFSDYLKALEARNAEKAQKLEEAKQASEESQAPSAKPTEKLALLINTLKTSVSTLDPETQNNIANKIEEVLNQAFRG